jgi:hypothetical protein
LHFNSLARTEVFYVIADNQWLPRYAPTMCTRKLSILVLGVALLASSASFAQLRPDPLPKFGDQLTLITSSDHKSVILTAAEFKAVPHISVTIHNSHTNADETYSGVRLADLLAKMGAPLGNDLRGKALADYVVATGSDGYKAVLALGEVDPAFHPGEVLVADAMDGKPLDAHAGPFKLVVSEDKRPARSVRNLVSIELKEAN